MEEKWYNHPKFPLKPQWASNKADKNNTSNFNFSWLFIKLWTLDEFEFELTLVADTYIGIGVLITVPYLRITVAIPCPISVDRWFYKHLDRKCEMDEE